MMRRMTSNYYELGGHHSAEVLRNYNAALVALYSDAAHTIRSTDIVAVTVRFDGHNDQQWAEVLMDSFGHDVGAPFGIDLTMFAAGELVECNGLPRRRRSLNDQWMFNHVHAGRRHRARFVRRLLRRPGMSTCRVFVNGRVHVRRSMCPTCVFRPGNLMHLHPGRLEGMVEDITANDGVIPCHQHLNEPITPVCRGQFDRHKGQTLQIAERLGVIEWTS